MRCRTGVPLRVLCIGSQQHMPCQRTARLVMVISLPDLLCCAWLLCMAALPVLHKIWWWKEEEETKRGRGGSHVSPERSAHKCVHPHALHAAWVTQQRVAHELAGIPPSTPQHEHGVWCQRTQAWQVCVVVVWATGGHAWRGGHGQLHSSSTWIPPVPSQDKREREGGRERERERERGRERERESACEQVSRCGLC